MFIGRGGGRGGWLLLIKWRLGLKMVDSYHP